MKIKIVLVLVLGNVVELFEHVYYLSERCSFDIFAGFIKEIRNCAGSGS